MVSLFPAKGSSQVKYTPEIDKYLGTWSTPSNKMKDVVRISKRGEYVTIAWKEIWLGEFSDMGTIYKDLSHEELYFRNGKFVLEFRHRTDGKDGLNIAEFEYDKGNLILKQRAWLGSYDSGFSCKTLIPEDLIGKRPHFDGKTYEINIRVVNSPIFDTLFFRLISSQGKYTPEMSN